MLHDQQLTIHADTDEGIADLDDTETTQSVRSSILERREEYGRLYNPHKDGAYHRPNDEAELDRLDIAGHVLTMINNGEFHLAPIGDSPGRVLDLGTGTGTWCIEMGDKYPSAEIIGVDISASMPQLVPPNVMFEIDDIEEDWTYSSPFNYIHSRYMVAAINDWQRLLNQCYANLSPGGWVELQDFDFHYYSQDGSLTENHAMSRWEALVSEAVTKLGRSVRVGTMLEQYVKNAGFVNIQVVRTPVPVGPWPRDRRLKEIGRFNWVQIYEGIPSVSLRLFIKVLGWTPEELQVFLVDVRNDLKNTKLHILHDVYSVWAQKPGHSRADGIDS